MADYIVEAVFRDSTTAGANAAAASLEKYAAAADKAQDATDKTDAVVRRLGPSAQNLAKRYDEVTAASSALDKAERSLAQAQDVVATGVAKGAINQQQASGILETLSGRVTAARKTLNELKGGQEEATASTAQFAFAQRQLGVQAIQTFSSIASGQGVLTALVQQGHQVIDVALATGTGLRGISEAAKGLFNAMGGLPTLLGGAVIAAFTALAVQSENAQRQLNELSNTLRFTRSDYAAVSVEVQKLSREIAATTNISAADALKAGGVIAGAGATVDQLQRLVLLSADISKALGIDVPAAAGQLAEAFRNPTQAAQQLADKGLRGMSLALVETIKHLQDSGDRAAATNVILETLTKSVTGAHDAVTPFQKALDDLANLFTSTSTGAEGLGKVLMDDVVAGMRAIIETIRNTIAEVKGLRDVGSELLNKFGLGNAAGNNLPGPIADVIARAAQGQGFNTQQTAFAQAVAQTESGGNQYDKFGSVLTSSAGARGIFQLLPSTASGLGVNPDVQSQNIQGGLQLIAHLWTKYHGDTQLIAMAYNWGEGNVDKFLSGVKTLQDVPKETSDYVQKVTGKALSTTRLTELSQVIDVTGGRSGGIANQQLQNDATKAALGVVSGDFRTQQADLQRMIELITKARQETQAGSDSWKLYTLALQDLGVKVQNTKSPLDLLLQQINDQTKQIEASNESWDQGKRAVNEHTAAVKAQEDALKFAKAGTQEFKDAVDQLTAAYTRQNDARSVQLTREYVSQQKDELEVINKETELLGQNTETRNRELAVLKERQELIKQGVDLESQGAEKALDMTAKVAEANSALQHQQQVIGDIQQFATSAFDSIANAITNAFVSGQGAAVNFGNVLRGILTQIINMILKLAVINPIMNSLFGGSATTLSDVGGVFGAAVGGGGGGGGSLLSGVGQLAGVGRAVSGGSSPGFLGGIFNTSLFTGAGGSAVTVGGLLGGAGLGFGAGSFLGTGVQGLLGKTGPGPTIGSAAGAIAGAAIGSIIPGIGTLIGGLIGGAGGGLLGGLFGGKKQTPFLNVPITVQPNGTLGIGNVAQQGGDYYQQILDTQQQVVDFNKFLGKQNISIAPSAFTGSQYGIANIGTGVGGFPQQQNLAQNFSRFQFTSPDSGLANALKGRTFEDTDTFTQFLSDTKTFLSDTMPALIKAGNDAGKAVNGFQQQLSDTNNKYNAAIGKARELNQAEGDLVNARDKVVAAMVKQQNDLVNSNILDIQNRGFVANAALATNPHQQAALQLQANLSQFDTSAQQQRKQLSALLTDSYGDAYATTTDYANKMAILEDTLGKERLAIVKQSTDQITALDQQAADAQKQALLQQQQIQQTIATSSVDIETRRQNALAAIHNDPRLAQGAQLYAFDQQARQQRDQLTANYKALFGNMYSTTSYFVTDMTRLNDTLTLERQALKNQLREQLAGQATGVVTSLTAFASGLRTSNLSPLSPQAQYSALSQQFAKVSGNAALGNITALTKLPDVASQLLTASRALFGSGTAYVTDFNKVLSALSKASQATPDTLTASVLQTETRTQTQTLVNELVKLRNEVVALKTQVQQNGATPLRIAA
jgi:hypothetical protein